MGEGGKLNHREGGEPVHTSVCVREATWASLCLHTRGHRDYAYEPVPFHRVGTRSSSLFIVKVYPCSYPGAWRGLVDGGLLNDRDNFHSLEDSFSPTVLLGPTAPPLSRLPGDHAHPLCSLPPPTPCLDSCRAP